MILKISFIFMLSSSIALASGLDLLLGKSSSKTKSATDLVQYQKKINLDDAFKVQLYGAHRAVPVKDTQFDEFISLILDDKHVKALKLSYELTPSRGDMQEILSAARVYLLFKNNLNQSFFNKWLELSYKENFLKTQFGLAIDQILSDFDSSWFFKNSILIDSDQVEVLEKIKDQKSYLNTLAQAYANLKTGEKALEIIGQLKSDDAIKLKLAQAAIIHYASTGELSKSARILKEIVEPALSGVEDLEVLSDFHMTLARLLYQAQAYEASEYYYGLIPEASKKYFQANIESLWISLRSKKYEKIKGHLKSLKLDIYKEKFVPEAYLVSSMANLYLCHFGEVQANIKGFVEESLESIKHIDKNLKSSQPSVLHSEDLFYNLAKRSIKALKREEKRISSINSDLQDKLKKQTIFAKELMNKEITKQWQNRKIILEQAIRKMRFVKVEFLSQMRRLKKELKLARMQDSVRTISAGIDKSDKFYFPYDGVLFGDEVFNITSEVKDICLRGQR